MARPWTSAPTQAIRRALFSTSCASSSSIAKAASGTVNVSDAAFAIDEEDAQDVEKRALRIAWVGALVHGLAIPGENRFQVLSRFRGREAPFAAGFFFTDGFGIISETLRSIVLRVEAHADEAHVFRQGLVGDAQVMKLVQDASRIRTRSARCAASV